MKNTIIKGLIIFVFGLIIIGCDPAISYEYYAQNNTDKEFQIAFMASGLNFNRPLQDSIVTILPGSKNLIVDLETWGSKPHDEGSNFITVFDTIYYVANDSIKITKVITKRENWKYDNDVNNLGLIKVGTNFYYLTIEDKDLTNINER